MAHMSYSRNNIRTTQPTVFPGTLFRIAHKESIKDEDTNPTTGENEGSSTCVSRKNRQTYIILKRGFDIVVSLIVVCTLLLLLYIILGLFIKLTSRGPVFFKQQRNGLNGKIFTILKFRTMITNAEADTRQATSLDERTTKVGRFLRKTSLDEIPQFWNVLMGDMSLVGPRPHMIHDNEYYESRIQGYARRVTVKPGITGLAQVMGYRGETRQEIEMVHRLRLDLWYIEHRSLMLDIYIVFYTGLEFLGFKKPHHSTLSESSPKE